MRAHLYKVITGTSGDVQTNTVVRVLQPDLDPLLAEPILVPVFADKTENGQVGTTFTVVDGIVDVWLDIEQYVMLGLTVAGNDEQFVDNVLASSVYDNDWFHISMDTDGVPYLTT